MPDNNEKTFDLATILSITTGTMYSDMTSVREVLSYLVGGGPMTDTGAKFVRETAAEYILLLHPQLKGLGENLDFNSLSEVAEYLDEQKAIVGNSFSLNPIPHENKTIKVR